MKLVNSAAAFAAIGFLAPPAIAGPIGPADAAAVQTLVQRTWARFGENGVAKGPRFDPPRTPAFNRAISIYQKPVPGEEGAPDNIYCQCFNEYKPRLKQVSLSGGASADVIEAHTVVADAMGASNAVIWRLVRSPQGWLLDDIWNESGPISIQRRPIRNGRRL